ncbi:response regulator [Ferruginibacter albus]|uniref:response regulator n=1 Tax=Ferruginibacter albus TaxID=2875540 RepID=UPI001CC3DF5C|nr:response regulator [Ferruginibacter albus]UAY53474.1 response regulator [Ferruginibacter albus]
MAKKILIIEDNTEVRENVAEILALSKYLVLSATNGKQGIEIALSENPDLIICDVMMPLMDGYAVLNALNMENATFGIPFIFLTARSERGDVRKGMEMGADDYITKPFTRFELLRAVEARLQKSESFKLVLAGNNNHVSELMKVARTTSTAPLISEHREAYTFKKKEVLYEEGQKPKAVYYIVKGKVKISKTNDEGKELIINICTEGDFFGYSQVLENINHTESAKVLEDAEIMLIAVDDFISLLVNDAQLSKQFIKIIAKNMLEKEQRLVSFAYNSLRKKVAYGLLQVYEKYENKQSQPGEIIISRENLAKLSGVATESLIRTLADFKVENLIDLEAGKVIFLNLRKLQELRD